MNHQPIPSQFWLAEVVAPVVKKVVGNCRFSDSSSKTVDSFNFPSPFKGLVGHPHHFGYHHLQSLHSAVAGQIAVLTADFEDSALRSIPEDSEDADVA